MLRSKEMLATAAFRLYGTAAVQDHATLLTHSASHRGLAVAQGPEAVADAVESEHAVLHGSEAHEGPEIEQQPLPAGAVAQAELGSAHSSKSSASQASSRRAGGMLRSTSSRNLDDTVREWQQPHAWLEKGPPASPCEQERLSTLYSIAPGSQLENLQHPKFGALLPPKTQDAVPGMHRLSRRAYLYPGQPHTFMCSVCCHLMWTCSELLLQDNRFCWCGTASWHEHLCVQGRCWTWRARYSARTTRRSP